MKSYPKYLDGLRYLCAVLLCFYGVSKLTGHQLVVPSWVAQKPIGSLDGYTLTWYYFGVGREPGEPSVLQLRENS